MLRPFVLLLVCMIPSFTRAETIDAERVTKAVTPYLNDDTFAVATVAVDADWPQAIANTLIEYGIVPESEHDRMRGQLSQATGMIAAVRGLGVREVSVVIAVADVRPNMGPLFVVSCDEPAQAALVDMLEQLAPRGASLETLWLDDTLIAGTQPTVQRYQALKSSTRDDLMAGLQAATANEASAGAVFSAGQDVRRAIRELWPTLPPPFKDLDADLLADGIRHLTVSVRKPPEWQATVTLTARDDASAKEAKVLAERGLVQIVKVASQERGGEVVAAMLTQAIPLLRPKQSGSELTIDIGHNDEAAKSLVTGALMPAVAASRASARRTMQMNDFKRIGLAMHNFHDVNKSFPAAAAICDEEGKPLLSWRVAILPYVEGQYGIYEKFHLDEPWDSEHNLKVARENLPPVYFHNMTDELRAAGKTTYQVPVTEGTAFAPRDDAKINKLNLADRAAYFRQGLSFRQVRDGTSQTIMAVQVADEHAVFWTKPEDWSPDLDDPLAKVTQEGREGFVSAFCDGHVRFMTFDVDPQSLKTNLTHAAGDFVQR